MNGQLFQNRNVRKKFAKRVDLLAKKRKLDEALGNKSDIYWGTLRKYFHTEYSKWEMDYLVGSYLGASNIQLHNDFILSIIYNKECSELPPGAAPPRKKRRVAASRKEIAVVSKDSLGRCVVRIPKSKLTRPRSTASGSIQSSSSSGIPTVPTPKADKKFDPKKRPGSNSTNNPKAEAPEEKKPRIQIPISGPKRVKFQRDPRHLPFRIPLQSEVVERPTFTNTQHVHMQHDGVLACKSRMLHQMEDENPHPWSLRLPNQEAIEQVLQNTTLDVGIQTIEPGVSALIKQALKIRMKRHLEKMVQSCKGSRKQLQRRFERKQEYINSPYSNPPDPLPVPIHPTYMNPPPALGQRATSLLGPHHVSALGVYDNHNSFPGYEYNAPPNISHGVGTSDFRKYLRFNRDSSMDSNMGSYRGRTQLLQERMLCLPDY